MRDQNMEHFYQNIQGWSDGIDLLYKQIVAAVPTPQLKFNGETFAEQPTRQYHFVEVGTWRGRSAAYMAVEIVNSGKNIRFDCVDTWQGTQNETEHLSDPAVQRGTLFEEFQSAMKPVEGHYRAVKSDSVAAADLYDLGSLDFVFIDADHSYEGCRRDILAWLPRVRPGGIIAGHDYNPEPDPKTGLDYGVGKAVRELLPNHRPIPWCWLYQLPQQQ